METIQINKKFATYEECEQWEEKNFPERTYQGRNIFMINHTEVAGEPEIVLESVVVL